jgi:hypothetical protein
MCVCVRVFVCVCVCVCVRAITFGAGDAIKARYLPLIIRGAAPKIEPTVPVKRCDKRVLSHKLKETYLTSKRDLLNTIERPSIHVKATC